MVKLREKLAAIGSFIVGLIVLVFYFKNKADNAATDAILGETKGRDKELKEQQDKVKDKIKQVENQDDSKLTPDQRSKRWDN